MAYKRSENTNNTSNVLILFDGQMFPTEFYKESDIALPKSNILIHYLAYEMSGNTNNTSNVLILFDGQTNVHL